MIYSDALLPHREDCLQKETRASALIEFSTEQGIDQGRHTKPTFERGQPVRARSHLDEDVSALRLNTLNTGALRAKTGIYDWVIDSGPHSVPWTRVISASSTAKPYVLKRTRGRLDSENTTSTGVTDVSWDLSPIPDSPP